MRVAARHWAVAVVAWALALCAHEVAGQDRSARLWSPKFEYLPVVAPQARTRLAVKPTGARLSLDMRTLLLERPDAPPLVAVRERAWPVGKDGVYWTGRIGKSGSATFTRTGRVLVGRFAAPDGRRYRLQFSAEAGDVLEEIDWRFFEVNHGPASAEPQDGPQPQTPDLSCGTDTGEVIDVLVVWASASMPTDPQLADAWTRAAELETNDALMASGVRNVTTRVVHVGQVAYTVSSTAQPLDVLMDLKQGNGGLAQAHELRDDHGADVVILVADIPSDPFFSGKTAFTFQDSNLGDSKGLAGKAFALLSPWSLTVQRGFFFEHEFGHVMGAQHEESSGDPFGHSQEHVSAPAPSCPLGLRTLGVSGCTTACAPCVTTCPKFGAWSNTLTHDPQVTQCNQPMGTGSEDNALTIQKTAKTIANIRCSKSPP